MIEYYKKNIKTIIPNTQLYKIVAEKRDNENINRKRG